MPPRARILLPLFLALLLLLSARTLCNGETPQRLQLRGETMGTAWALVINTAQHADAIAPQQLRLEVQKELDAVENAMSTWRADSELSRFNRHQSLQPFAFQTRAWDVMQLAQQISSATEGAFDITIGPLVAAWGFGAAAAADAAGEFNAPDESQLKALRESVGFRKLQLQQKGMHRSARKLHPKLQVDLSAIAKGYGVDAAARRLIELGHNNFMLEIGGEVRAHGVRPDGAPWRLGIEQPPPLTKGAGNDDDGARKIFAAVPLHNQGLATSGDYRNFHSTKSGARVMHIIDPRSGRPAKHNLASVSVVHKSAAVADAWATALLVLGPRAGLQLAEAHNIAAYFIARATESGEGARTIESTGESKSGEQNAFTVYATRNFPAVQRAGQMQQ